MDENRVVLQSFHSTSDFTPLTMGKLGVLENFSFFDPSKPPDLISSFENKSPSLEMLDEVESFEKPTRKYSVKNRAKILIRKKPLGVSWKFIESCFPNFFRPSWLSRSHESLVFNSVYSPATNQNAVPVLSNQNADSSHDRIVESSAEYHFNQSNNFPPIHSSHSQYFNSHHLEGSGNSGRKLRNHQHRPSLALDSNENILLQSSTSTNENEASIFSSANHCSQSNLRQLKSSLGGSRLTTLTTDNYLHMNGGPNGMGPVVIGGGGTPSTLAMSGSSHPNRTSSTNNLQQMHHSSTLEKQKLDR